MPKLNDSAEAAGEQVPKSKDGAKAEGLFFREAGRGRHVEIGILDSVISGISTCFQHSYARLRSLCCPVFQTNHFVLRENRQESTLNASPRKSDMCAKESMIPSCTLFLY